jgi:hypothetical protein
MNLTVYQAVDCSELKNMWSHLAPCAEEVDVKRERRGITRISQLFMPVAERRPSSSKNIRFHN